MKTSSTHQGLATRPSRSRGVALVIVLSFIVLLTGLVVAYFSRTMTDRQLSNSSYSGNNADAFAQSASDIIISDLKQEIVNGSTATTVGPASNRTTIYTPTSPANMLPVRSGNPATPSGGVDPIPNLVRISSGTATIASPGINSRATAISSAPSPSPSPVIAKRGEITPPRWNKHYLIPQFTPGTPSDTTPVAGFTPPDWVFVTSDGGPKVITATDFPKVVGRYAYAIYDEGGLLDVNVAGYPSASTTGQKSSKMALSYADLTNIGSAGLTPGAVDDLVGWRNYASLQAPGSFGSFTGLTAASATNYFNYVAANSTGFLKVNNTAWNNRTDQMFLSRQELISYSKSASWNTSTKNLQYLTHFSRDLNQPSFAPDSGRPKIRLLANGGNDMFGKDAGVSPADINPSFLQARVTTSFTRNDGSSTANIGEPLVIKRFALNRLAWLTYQGVSATRPTTSPPSTPTGPDYDIYLMENTHGLDKSFLAQGNAANVYRFFGLSWVSDSRPGGSNGNGDGQMKWVYNHGRPNPASAATTSPIASLGAITAGPIMSLSQVAAAGREPDFVELLKASITAGSLAKGGVTGAATTPQGYQNSKDTSVDAAIIQIASNIIDQYDTDSVATRIIFDDTTWTPAMEYRGVEDLPYVYRVRSMVFPLKDSTPAGSYQPAVSADEPTAPKQGDMYDPSAAGNTPLTDSGLAVALNAPEIWNPHSWKSGSPAAGPRPTQFRMIAVNAPATISTPPASDPNKITMQGFTRSNISSISYKSSTPGVTMLPANTIHALSFIPDSTALYFTIPFNPSFPSDANTSRLDLFREPTFLIKPGIPEGSKLHFGGDGGESQKNQVFNSSPETGGSPGEAAIQPYIQVDTASNYKGIKALTTGDYPSGYTNNSLFLGIYLGSFPIKWQDGSYVFTASSSNAAGGTIMTYRLQYQDPLNAANWITYDEKYTNLTNSTRGLNTGSNRNPRFLGWKLMGNNSDGLVSSCIDPRSSRFGLISNGHAYNSSGDFMNAWSSTTAAGSQSAGAKQSAMRSMRIDETNMNYFKGYTAPGWNIATSPDLRPGLLLQNNPNVTAPFVQYFADADGVVRRGMSAYLQPSNTQAAVTRPSSGPSGIPTAVAMDFSNASSTAAATQITNEIPSRPIMLNRPFRSLAEIGYVYSGTPWRNLDLATPESGNAALLDVFCINDTDNASGLAAGKVNLNTRQPVVLQAILAGAYKDEFSLSTTVAATGNPPSASADTIAKAFAKRTNDLTSSLGAGSGPLLNKAELVGKWNSSVAAPDGVNVDGGQSYKGFSGTHATSTAPSTNPPNLSSLLSSDTSSGAYYSTANVQRFREATVRALANTTQTRLWNLMIDVVAQTGRCPSTAANFLVEGEQRYWVHVAIDRYTGQVVDKQIEVVKE